MASSKGLTGGTGDVNPQILNIVVSQTAADVTTTGETPLPIPRGFSSKKGKAIVLEILHVTFNFDDLITPGGAVILRATLSTTGAAVAPGDPEVFSVAEIDGIFATAVGFGYNSRVIKDVLHDGAGHGFLVATDNLFLTMQSGNTARINTVIAKIFYRFKEVSLAEYIGIVQGQQ